MSLSMDTVNLPSRGGEKKTVADSVASRLEKHASRALLLVPKPVTRNEHQIHFWNGDRLDSNWSV